ncbi:MAG: alpha-L-arabinofuranosidase C-terminal domain-containing protein [Planctomycetota bacterium]
MTTFLPLKMHWLVAAVVLSAAVCCQLHGQALQATVAVDATKPGPSINPYVYGQFIEHLGRCIRGGIWAEMLYDRKLLLEPGKSWQTVGPEGANFDAAHDTAGAYCGDHAMALWVRDAGGGACGIRQAGLGLIEGKEYVGYAILCHVADPAPVTVRLAWGEEKSAGQSVEFDKPGTSYEKLAFRFRAGATTDDASLSLTMIQPGCLWIACLSLMPADNLNGMRADTLALLKQLDSPIYRWPGGNFVSGYDWKDGIGPRDRRPPRWERAWEDVEDNDFGIDEFIAFCREINTEPLVVVNTGLGPVEDAAQLVEYANGSPKTRWGSHRARAGHPNPYDVDWWGIGNEMYGGWQLGNVPVERYTLRHNVFVRAMKAIDPKIKVVAVGAPGKWNDVVMPRCAASMDLLSAHHYTQRGMRVPFSSDDARKYEEDFLEYSGHVAVGVRRLIDDLRSRQHGSDPAMDHIRLSVDEWGIVREWDPAPDGPGIGKFEVYYPLGDAIANGRALHELIRAADVVEMAQWAQTVNVIGAIKTSRTHASMGPVGHLLTLYRAQVGGRLLPAEVVGDVPVDVVAARDDTSRTLCLGLINYSPKDTITVQLELDGAADLQPATAWRIHGENLASINVPGQPEEVTTRQLPDPVQLDKPVLLPAHSITVLCAGK